MSVRFIALRLYGPTEAWFEGTWRPGEIGVSQADAALPVAPARNRCEAMGQRAESRTHEGGALIDADVQSGFIGHSYFYSDPAVLSDLILILRDNRAPGAANGRPLIHRGRGFWALEDGYPNRKPDE